MAVDTGLLESEVLSTLLKPTIDLVIPVAVVVTASVGIVTVPVNVGDAIGDFNPIEVVNAVIED